VNYALANGTNGGIATNYSLSPSLVATTITPKQLTVTGSVATSRQYDGTRNVEVAVGTVTGYVGSETLLISATGVTDSADVGTRTASVTYALANGANGGIGENYSLLSQSISSVISKKTLTVTNTSVATRQYDGTPSMNPTVGTVTGYVGSESLAVTATAVVESSNAGSRTATVTYTLANGENSGLASNYSLAPGSVATTIERRELSISGSTVASRAYNGSTTVTALPGTITGLVGSENLVVTATGVLNSPNAGTRIATVTYTLLNGANGGIGSNYVLDADEIQTTIAKKTLTAVGTTAVGRVYDGTSDISIVVGTISGLVGTETLSVGASGTSISANVGTHTTSVNFQVTDGLNGGVAANYLLASTTIQATISRKSLIVNGTTVSSRQYNGSRVIVAEAGTLTGLVGTESLTLSASGLLDTANAGNRTALIVYTLGDGENGGIATNYEAISDSLAVTIAPKELSVLGTTASNRQYNGSATVGVTVGSISGLVGNETLAITASGVADSANAGQRNVIISYQLSNGSNGGLASNYVLSSSTAQVAIARRILLVSGSVVANKTYNGTSNATVSLGTVSNFVAAERPLITASASFHDVVPGTQSATVTYVVADDSATSALGTNYEVAAQTLSAEISKATISFTVSARDRVYNGTTRASLVIGSPVGVVAGDEVEIDSDKIEGSFNDAEPGLNRLVNLTISSGLLVGADAGNYLYQAPSNPRADITKANQSGFEFTSPTSFFADSSLTLQASGGQTANEITYSVVSGVCQVSGSRLTASRGGSSCAVSATRPGDSRYNSAATSITIRVDKVLQNLVFRSQAPVSPVVGSRYTVDVDSDVALAPTIAIANSSTTVCSISAGVVTFNAIGNCLISASQSGNDVYAAAAASQSITVVAAPVATTVPPAPAGQGATTNTSSTTIPQTAVPAPASTTATTSTTTTTTTTTIPADPGRPYLVDGKSPSLEVGEATAIVRGQVVNVITTTENGQLTMTLPGRVIVKIGTTNSASGEAQVGSDGKLRMYGDTEVSVEVSGFVPDSTYTVFMFSEPLELGRGETGADGSVRDSLLVPSDVEAGEHTLQMNGVGPGDEVVSISMGFEVMERQSNTRIAVIVIMFAIALALLGGRPIFARRRVRA
jgi:flagella basal body P-ring formation protein FlgA